MDVEVVPDEHEGAVELLVGCDQQAPVVAPGEALALCDAVGVLVVENSDTFGVVCRRLPELTSRWLCVWGSGYATDQLVAVLDWLSPLPVAAWCDLDADGIAVVDNLSRRLGRPVHAVGMRVDEWEAGPYRQRQKPEEDRERDRLLAALVY